MNTLPSELIIRILEFKKDNPWKVKYDMVVKEIPNVSFQCLRYFDSSLCEICYDNEMQQTRLDKYDVALSIYLDNCDNIVNPSSRCQCILQFCRIDSEFVLKWI
jgi:hypothetical protein